MTPIPTVIVTSSPLTLSRLHRAFASEPGIAIAGHASDLSGAYVLVEQKEPKLVILGPELARHPDFGGILAMFRVMGITWMRIASDPPPPDPVGRAPALDTSLPVAGMMAQIRAALARPAADTTATPRPAAAPVPASARWRPDRVVLIGSSTGGIDALLRVLSVFPADCPPTAIVQHTGQAFSDSLIRPMAETLLALGTIKAWLVHGGDGTDEISIAAPTRVSAVEHGAVHDFTLHPEDAGLPYHPFERIMGGTPAENAQAFRALLDGAPGAYRDAVLLNAAAALVVADKAGSLPEGVEMARAAIDSGAAKAKVAALARLTHG